MNGSTKLVAAELPDALEGLWRFALRLTASPDDAEELVQQTCARALDRAHQYQPGTQLKSWLFAIMHSQWKNELRSRSVRRNAGFTCDTREGEAGMVADHQERTPDQASYHQQVVELVNTLPEAQRETVLLVYVEGFAYREAAEILEVPIGTVMSRLARARAILSEKLDAERNGVTISEPAR